MCWKYLILEKMEPTNTSLEDVLKTEYSTNDAVTFEMLRSWESQLDDPFELARLYDTISMDHILTKSGIKQKQLEPGLLGYIKGQKINVLERIEKMTTTDALTGLPNNRSFEKILTQCLERYEREDYAKNGKRIGLILMDINDFKTEANDKHGHQFGNKILVYTGEALNSLTRVTDEKARLSGAGDEFVVLIDPLVYKDNSKSLGELTQKLNLYVQKRIRENYPEKESAVSFSLGMSIFGVDAQTKASLLHNADTAMYHAKRNPIKTEMGILNFHVFNTDIEYGQ